MEKPKRKKVNTSSYENLSLYEIDDEDYEILKDKPPSYIRGWNLVKRKKTSKE